MTALAWPLVVLVLGLGCLGLGAYWLGRMKVRLGQFHDILKDSLDTWRNVAEGTKAERDALKAEIVGVAQKHAETTAEIASRVSRLELQKFGRAG